MRRSVLVIALFLGPMPLLAHVIRCGEGPFGTRTGPVPPQVEMFASGTNLHYQTGRGSYIASVGVGSWSAPALGTPSVSIQGNEIDVTQTYAPPQPSLNGVSDSQFCQTEDVNIGTLAPGVYNVSWTYVAPVGRTTVNGTVTVTGSNPCSTAPSSAMTLTRTPAATAHLHIESINIGYQPVFGTPVVTSIADGIITIDQPLTDTFDYEMPGAPPAGTFCHADDVDLGILAAGSYRIEWTRNAVLGGTGPYHLPIGGLVIWSGTAVVCSSGGTFSTLPSVPGSSAPVTLLVTGAGYNATPTYGISATVEGNVIDVIQEIDTEGPPPPTLLTPQCFTTAVNVPPLPIGDYTVVWQVIDLGNPVALSTYHFSVVQGRRRTTRR